MRVFLKVDSSDRQRCECGGSGWSLREGTYCKVCQGSGSVPSIKMFWKHDDAPAANAYSRWVVA